MEKEKNRILVLYFFCLIIIAYLVFGTGAVSDDYIYINQTQGKYLFDILNLRSFLDTPIEEFTHHIWYSFFRLDNLVLLYLLKTLYLFLSFYFTSKFFSIFFNVRNSFLASFLFIFFPSHDATVYWFLGQYLTLTMAFYLHAFYLAHNNRLAPAFCMAALASFLSYGSPVIAFSLSLFFLTQRQLKKGLALLVPNLMYVIYYIAVSKIAGISTKISEGLSIQVFTKQLILQILTFTDAVTGPSMWLKIYYSFFQLTAPSFLIGALLVLIFYKTYQETAERVDRNLIMALSTLTAASFVMFASTGRYPQLAFNLGDRVTIFGSLFVVYLIFLISASRKAKTVFFAVLIFSILGISDHWKAWSRHQDAVIDNIKNNKGLKEYQDWRVLYVAKNQYSRFGPLSHIEFFAESSSLVLFDMLIPIEITVKPINKRFRYVDGYLLDTKYGERDAVNGYINVYDSEASVVLKIGRDEINNYIGSLSPDYRHWVQIWNFEYLKRFAARLMPRLQYAMN